MAGISVILPLSLSSDDGAYSLHKDLETAVKQNLKMLMLTVPGERVMDPNFGVGIQQYLFEQNTIMLHQRIKERIQEQIDRYMPFLSLKATLMPRLDDSASSDNNMLSVKIKYFIDPLNKEGVLAINVPRPGDNL